jgi:RNA 3'-terminal phosphate cyclase (ATP)
MIIVDGSRGEGGGQILRTSLALSLITGQPFRMENIRAGRSRPGLLRQHLTGVKAAAEIGGAAIEGAELGSKALTFRPTTIRGGDYHFAIGSAGSATLVLQTVLPALLRADGPSTLKLEGGTHNPSSPPFDFLERTFLPVLRRMGAQVTVKLDRPGFYPAGGGVFSVAVTPSTLAPIELMARGHLERVHVEARVAGIPRHVATRQVEVLAALLDLSADCSTITELPRHVGPGNVVLATLQSEHLTEVVTGFGEKGVPAEDIARGVAEEALSYRNSGAPVGSHLADQLLLPMVLSGGGRFRTVAPTEHTRTQVETIRLFMDRQIDLTEKGRGQWIVDVRSLSA